MNQLRGPLRSFTTPHYKLAWIALLVALWFSLGSSLNVLMVVLGGERIEFVVCSGTGIKKISVPADETDKAVPTVKHCANAPLLASVVLPGDPAHLHFEPPSTVASWSWMPETLTTRDMLRGSYPPPGRAPPVRA